jgi:hypothetical protein
MNSCGFMPDMGFLPLRAAGFPHASPAQRIHFLSERSKHIASNPASSKGPMVAIIMSAFLNLCWTEIEKAQSPKTAPSQR